MWASVHCYVACRNGCKYCDIELTFCRLCEVHRSTLPYQVNAAGKWRRLPIAWEIWRLLKLFCALVCIAVFVAPQLCCVQPGGMQLNNIPCALQVCLRQEIMLTMANVSTGVSMTKRQYYCFAAKLEGHIVELRWLESTWLVGYSCVDAARSASDGSAACSLRRLQGRLHRLQLPVGHLLTSQLCSVFGRHTFCLHLLQLPLPHSLHMQACRIINSIIHPCIHSSIQSFIHSFSHSFFHLFNTCLPPESGASSHAL